MSALDHTIDLPDLSDKRGSLIAAEIGKQLPFVVKRVFVIAGVGATDKRGMHAHRACHQFLMCLQGQVKALIDDGRQSSTVLLDRPTRGLYMPPLTWGTQWDYSPDAILLVLASECFDPDDYIHDYDEFKSTVNSLEAASKTK